VVGLAGVGTNATVLGTGYVGLTASDESLALASSGATAATAPGMTGDTIVGNGETIYVAAGSGGTINGNGTNIGLVANSGSLVYVEGTGDGVAGNSGSNVVWLAGVGTSATVLGTGYVGLTASNESLALASSGAAAATAANTTGDTIVGSGETTSLGGNSTGTVEGTNDAVWIESGDNLDVGSTDMVYLVTNGVSATATFEHASGSSDEQMFNPQSGVVDEIRSYSGANDSGTLTDLTYDWTAGGSQTTFYNPWSGVSEAVGNFTGFNDGGELNTSTIDYTDGYTDDFTFYYNNSGDETYYSSDLYNPGGSQPVWTGDYSATGQWLGGSVGTYTDSDGTYGDGGDEGDDDFGDLDLASSPTLAGPPGTNVGVIVNADLAVGDTAAAAAGLQAYVASQDTGAVPQATSMFEGPTWSNNVITWSLATTPGTASSPFSSYKPPAKRRLRPKPSRLGVRRPALLSKKCRIHRCRISASAGERSAPPAPGYWDTRPSRRKAVKSNRAPSSGSKTRARMRRSPILTAISDIREPMRSSTRCCCMRSVMRSGLPTTPTRTR
jgi:hypothetical protein